MRFLGWIIGIPLIVLAIAFAIANGETVTFTYSPVNDPLTWPLYALVLFALLIGFIVGAVMSWAAGHRDRRDKRRLQKAVGKMEREITTLQAHEEVMTTTTLTDHSRQHEDIIHDR